MDLNISGIKPGKDKGEKEPAGEIENLIIIGAGPAGMSAALYAARAELKPLLLTGTQIGGQIALSHIVENYPGFPDGTGGAELTDLFQKHAERFGARFEFDHVTSVDLSKPPYLVNTYSKQYKTKALILATGATPLHLNVPGETELTGKGVSYCGTCDGFFFKDKKVIVVGGGDSALEEGLFLTRFASSVTVVHRRDELRAGAFLTNKATSHPKIDFIWNTIITEIIGEKSVESVRLKNVVTGEERVQPIDGVFIFIGHQPNTDMYEDYLDIDDKGYVMTDTSMKTRIPGVFVAGEIADPTYRQVVTSAGMGAAAAIQVTRYLEENED